MGESMWYVIQTVTGQEELLVRYMGVVIEKEILLESFIARREQRKHLGGKWRTIVEKLFPGYVFVFTGQPDALFLKLKEIPKLSRLLGDSGQYFIPLGVEETELILRIGNKRGDHTARISRVCFETGNRVAYIDGDLKEFEGEIVGFNLRKRQAIVHTELFGGKDIYMGIDFLEKIEPENNG